MFIEIDLEAFSALAYILSADVSSESFVLEFFFTDLTGSSATFFSALTNVAAVKNPHNSSTANSALSIELFLGSCI